MFLKVLVYFLLIIKLKLKRYNYIKKEKIN